MYDPMCGKISSVFSQKRQLSSPWRRGIVVRLQNTRSQVRIPPGCKVFGFLYIAVLLSKT
jgi:hypothetical protein